MQRHHRRAFTTEFTARHGATENEASPIWSAAAALQNASHLGARVVKAFNTIWFEHLKSKGNKNAPIEERRAIIVSGDDAEAKHIVSKLIEEIGFGPYDIGSLSDSRDQQPEGALYNRDVTVAEARAIARS